MASSSASDGAPTIVRTERGLSISGTRITLYRVMDYVVESYPAKAIRDELNLTDEQVAAALAYIEANREQVEAEYQKVLQQAAERRQYWEERNKEVLARIRSLPPQPGKEALYEELRAQERRVNGMTNRDSAADAAPTIVRTERGLTISGTRTTLYFVMDYVKEGYPAKAIRDELNLTDAQVAAALEYIAANREQVEAEYERVLRQAAEKRQYWEERNKEVLARIRSLPPQPGKEALYEKLRAEKARLGLSP